MISGRELNLQLVSYLLSREKVICYQLEFGK